MELQKLIKSQHTFFESHQTLNVNYRISKLKELKKNIKQFEEKIYRALQTDLGKTEAEAFITEVNLVYAELNLAIAKLKKWSKPKKVFTPVILWPSVSYILPSPLGVVLIISPWNYPFQLTFTPLISAIAAGNCAIVKPSEFSVETGKVIETIIEKTFNCNYVKVVKGEGHIVVPKLFEAGNFNHVFFTGSTQIGKLVYQMAAKQLASVTLELGGKSPTIIHQSANLKLAAKRIIWGKFFNAGQTCIAPDYILVHESIKTPFIKLLNETIKELNINKLHNKIINRKQIERLQKITKLNLNESNGIIEPQVLDNISITDEIMQHEIFGPILPVLSYTKFDEMAEIIKQNPSPLAVYLFSNDSDFNKKVLTQFNFGGATINNTLYHIANHNLPFGGVGNSGIGNYHGYFGFKTFSHFKGINKTYNWFDLKLKYYPFGNQKFKWLKRIYNFLH